MSIQADPHNHTLYSHGKNTPWEMYNAANGKGLKLIGFSEHSPRPAGFDYTHEYREQLTKFLPTYIKEVGMAKEKARNEPDSCQVLLGLEMDWLEGQCDFIEKSITAYDYDYLIGSVHFIGHWGYDDGVGPWAAASQEQCEVWYKDYFKAWRAMLESGLFQIAAHPDLIKIFSVDKFAIWLQKAESQQIIRACLQSLKNSGMAMEVSSAGLRKACKEIYPGPIFMQIAAELNIPISMASDAHCVGDVGGNFVELEGYAREFGYTGQTIYDHGKATFLPF